jgi:hypothetical protein
MHDTTFVSQLLPYLLLCYAVGILRMLTASYQGERLLVLNGIILVMAPLTVPVVFIIAAVNVFINVEAPLFEESTDSES